MTKDMVKKVHPLIKAERERITNDLNKYFEICETFEQTPTEQMIEDIIYDTVADRVVELPKEYVKKLLDKYEN